MKPASKAPAVRAGDDGTLVIAVREPALEGRANEAARKALAAYLDVAPSRVRIVRGAAARLKTFSVE